MKKKEFRKYMKEEFLLDIRTEYAIYMYLCKQKVRRKKLLSDDIKFNRYKDWKNYIINKYQGYGKDSLQEFNRMLNFQLRDSRKLDGFFKNICIACISAAIATIMSNMVMNKLGSVKLLIAYFLLTPTFSYLFLCIYKFYTLMSEELHFYEDVKEIIEEIIAGKISSE